MNRTEAYRVLALSSLRHRWQPKEIKASGETNSLCNTIRIVVVLLKP